ncbi:MAG: fasciclin domain-containing protein [Bacteroidota bacterium]
MKKQLLKFTTGAATILSLLMTPAIAMSQTTIYQAIQNSANHTILEQAVDAAGLDATLDAAGADLTVFAPDDAAFTAYFNETGTTASALLADPDLGDILQYHVLNGTTASSGLSNGQIETPLNNANTLKFTIDGATPYVNQSIIDNPDIPVTNGALHSIDQVLLVNETVADVAIDSPNHTTLVSAVIEARLLPELTDPFDTLTVFAPTDNGFSAALNELGITAADLLADPDLANKLLYHVLGVEVTSGDLSNGDIVTPLNNNNTLKVTLDAGDVFINQAQVTNPDVSADNGTVHVLDAVVLENETVADIAIDSPDHTTLVSAVVEARLLPALTDPFDTTTVFAPTDAAFTDALNALNISAGDLLADPDLANILLYHVLGAEVTSGDLSNGDIATPLNSNNTLKVTIDGSDVFINQAQVTTPDLAADNGTVHVLDEVVLENETVADIAIDSPDHTTFVSAVIEARLLPAATDPFDTMTVFAPTDAAFTQYLSDEGISAGDLLASPDLTDILLYHVLGAEVLSTDLTNGPVTTINGADVVVDLSNGVMINSANVTAPDLTADNGVVHALDYVLDPAEASIKDENIVEVKLFPNPAVNNIQVTGFDKANYTVVNSAGSIVKNGELQGSTINVETLDHGTYTILLNNEKQSAQSTFVKK